MRGDATQHLVQQASRGDDVAIDALLVRHLPALVAYVRLHADPLLRRHESCADLAQSVCREVLQDLDGFVYRGDPAFRCWLFTLALRKLINRKRHYLAQRRDVLRQQPLTEGHCSQVGVAAVYSSMCSPSHGAIAHETAERLERAFDRLPEDYRTVITLARLLGLSHAEVAAEMGRQQGAVRTLLSRALVRLGRFMAEDEERSQSGVAEASV
jgi:RNA polymerase sigma-70 factor (subfamily 1)